MLFRSERILKERKILEGFQALHSATTNGEVRRNCEAKMRESGRAIGWFEESLRDLGQRAQGPQGAPAMPAGRMSTPPGGDDARNRNLPAPPPGAAPSWQQQRPQAQGQQPPQQQGQQPPQQQEAGQALPKTSYTSLGEQPCRRQVA